MGVYVCMCVRTCVCVCVCVLGHDFDKELHHAMHILPGVSIVLCGVALEIHGLFLFPSSSISRDRTGRVTCPVRLVGDWLIRHGSTRDCLIADHGTR